MRRNVLALILVNCLFGVAFGVYELAFPLYLDDVAVRLETIGLVLAAGAAVNFFIMIYGGWLTDRFGRKGIYGGNLLALAAATAATPLAAHVAVLALLKTVQRTCVSLDRTLRGVLLYESVPPERFTRRFGQIAGLEASVHGLGFLCVGFLCVGSAAVLSYRGVFWISAVALVAGAMVFLVLFRERYHPAPPEQQVRLTLRRVFTLDLNPKLYLIIAAGFLAMLGFGVSHGLWMLYFRQQFDGPWAGDLAAFDAHLHRVWPALASVWTAGGQGAQFALISLIAVVHRLLMGVPMVLVAPLLTGPRQGPVRRGDGASGHRHRRAGLGGLADRVVPAGGGPVGRSRPPGGGRVDPHARAVHPDLQPARAARGRRGPGQGGHGPGVRHRHGVGGPADGVRAGPAVLHRRVPGPRRQPAAAGPLNFKSTGWL